MVGRPHVHHRLTGSTNARARELALAGAPGGTLVTADAQSAGRGRAGRSWLGPLGEVILMSLVVRDLEQRHALLPLAAAVATCEACEATAAVECTIKWPNDVQIDGLKLAGTLVEGRPQEGWAVVGIGLNVNVAADDFPEEIHEIATSLSASAGEPVDREAVLAALVEALARRLEDPAETIIAAWRERDALRGSQIVWQDGAGIAMGIDDGGALLVDVGGRVVTLDAGEVHLQRPGRGVL